MDSLRSSGDAAMKPHRAVSNSTASSVVRISRAEAATASLTNPPAPVTALTMLPRREATPSATRLKLVPPVLAPAHILGKPIANAFAKWALPVTSVICSADAQLCKA